MIRNMATITNAITDKIPANIPPVTLPLPEECDDEIPSSRVKRSGSDRILAPEKVHSYRISRKEKYDNSYQSGFLLLRQVRKEHYVPILKL